MRDETERQRASSLPYMGLVDRRPVVCRNLAMGFWVPLHYDLWPEPSGTRQQQRPARRLPTVTEAAATTLRPAHQAQRPLLTRPEQRQGPPAVSSPPYQPSMSAHIKQMPGYRRHRESKPNCEAETVRAYPRVQIRPRPRSPRTPTAQDYGGSPGPATATSPHDPTTPTYAHTSAQGHGPAQGQWWQGWTHTQLSELRK